MSDSPLPRRDFLRTLAGASAAVALDWDAFPKGVSQARRAGAWSRPGHGYGAVIPSGLECIAEVVKAW